MARRSLVLLGATAVLLLGAAPAAPPDAPVNYIGVDELKRRLDAGVRADVFDVRTWYEYRELHIKGAESMPLRTVDGRIQEIPPSGLVVFY